ncbi:MAG: hypothetical protein ACO1N9_05810 [Flavobacterium sp.]
MRILILLLLIGLKATAQVNISKDTLHLEEVVIGSERPKVKIRTEKLRGPCYAAENMADANEIVTLVDGLKSGYLNSVAFHFNEMYFSKKIQPDSFKDTDFELVIYKVNPDDTPGEKLIDDVMVVTVKKEHKGSITLYLAGLDIQSPGKIFIGLKRMGWKTSQNQFYIDCLCNGHDKYFTYTRKNTEESWSRNWVCAALKIDVSVANAK